MGLGFEAGKGQTEVPNSKVVLAQSLQDIT